MNKRNNINFIETEQTITTAVTKFGGQPYWIDEPQWPISKELCKQMRFICQIKLIEDIFPGCQDKMAYIFMTEDDEYVDATWEPDGGENAVILQPGGQPQVEVQNIVEGPTLLNYVKVDGHDRLQPIDIEYMVNLVSADDPNFIPESTTFDMADNAAEEYGLALEGNKIGGTPGFLQGDEFPDDSQPWKLLLQLDSSTVPFSINFGDAGIAYAFVNEDYTIGKFLWQCC